MTTSQVRRTAGRAGPTERATWWSPAVLPGAWTGLLTAGVAALVALHLLVNALTFYADDFPGRETAARLVDLNGEGGVPAWFSTLLLAAVAAAAWQLADHSRDNGRERWVRHERGLAVVFLYLSLDEMVQLHELTREPLQEALDLGGVFTYAWVILFVPVALVVAVLYLRWLRALPPAAARLVLLAGVLYVGGAAGLELFEGALEDADQRYSMTYAVAVAVEEACEMLGVLVMLSVVLWLRRRPERSAR